MAKPFFSIIIATLNEEKLVPRLLEDLRKQKHQDYEILVVDAHSTDNTVKIIRKFAKREARFRLICCPKRNFIYQRNLGAVKAVGKYLIFLDADVQVTTRYLQELFNEINRSGALFLTTYQMTDTRNALDKILIEISNYILDLLPVLNKQMAPGYNFVVEKKLFFKVGKFDEGVTMSEDHELSIRVFKQGVSLKIVPERLLKWSFRRLKKDGRLPIIFKYSLAALNVMILGKVTHKYFSYQMGGHYFKEAMKRHRIEPEILFTKYLSKIKRSFKDVFD
jgi:glycosyltransferase involved in cell wall biosynthesis